MTSTYASEYFGWEIYMKMLHCCWNVLSKRNDYFVCVDQIMTNNTFEAMFMTRVRRKLRNFEFINTFLCLKKYSRQLRWKNMWSENTTVKLLFQEIAKMADWWHPSFMMPQCHESSVSCLYSCVYAHGCIHLYQGFHIFHFFF